MNVLPISGIKTLATIVLLCRLACPIPASAQQKKTKSASPATMKESWENLKGVFRKKDKPAQGDTIQGSNQKPVPLPQNVRQVQGGKIAAGAVYLDVDDMTDFNDGVAVVRKGTSYAMIDAKGNTVVPFNRYSISGAYRGNSGMAYPGDTYSYLNHKVGGTGLFQIGNYRYINAQGQEIKNPTKQDVTFSFTQNKAFLTAKAAFSDRVDQKGNRFNTYYYMDKTGKVYTHAPLELTDIQEGIGIVTTGGKRGYVALDGRKVTDIVYEEATAFSDGMAMVGQKDQFGIIKYGFVNAQGQLAIPLAYSKKPTHFSCGFAIVYPKDYPSKDDQLSYAFINKKGQVVRSFTVADAKQYSFPPFQDYGLTAWGRYFMDTAFRIIPKEDFFAWYGLKGNIFLTAASFDQGAGKMQYRERLFTVIGETDPKIYFIINGTKSGIGFINLATNTVVLPAFTKLGYFDPVSRLAYAEIGQNQDAIKGYVNEQGQWVILKSKGGTW